MRMALEEKFRVLNVYIIKFKRLKTNKLSISLGNNPKKAKGRKLCR